MTPLIPNKILTASLFAALALVLTAQAGARPILDGDGLGDTTTVAVIPDAFERAVTAQAPQTPLWEQALMARSQAMNEFYAAQASQTPAWEKALMARSQAMNEFYAAQTPQVPAWEKALTARSQAMNEFYAAQTPQVPAWEKALTARSQAMNEFYADKANSEPGWLKALNARSEAMNAYYGTGSTGVVRPDDRGTPRPMVTGTVVSGHSSDGTAWQDVSVGALGGFGLALLVGLGGFALLRSHRAQSTIAH
jgi:hypothetical protein